MTDGDEKNCELEIEQTLTNPDILVNCKVSYGEWVQKNSEKSKTVRRCNWRPEHNLHIAGKFKFPRRPQKLQANQTSKNYQ